MLPGPKCFDLNVTIQAASLNQPKECHLAKTDCSGNNPYNLWEENAESFAQPPYLSFRA